eukprot:6733190-Prymnesium_polylepis.1
MKPPVPFCAKIREALGVWTGGVLRDRDQAHMAALTPDDAFMKKMAEWRDDLGTWRRSFAEWQ